MFVLQVSQILQGKAGAYLNGASYDYVLYLQASWHESPILSLFFASDKRSSLLCVAVSDEDDKLYKSGSKTQDIVVVQPRESGKGS